MIQILAIAAGGATGAVLRHFFNSGVLAVTGATFPLGILAINVLGSLVMGLLAGFFAHVHEPSQALKLFLTVGVLGGFTTFSAFSLDAVLLWERGEILQSLAYVLCSVVFSIAALAAGLFLVRVLSV
ncbi:MAG: fluoride efflux transporter CrcB [Micavibrio aeruginosavorus]|nr:fluoride efflux transporter CrcB [Micavibrio aeruginosavorus]